MDALDNDADFQLINPRTGKPVRSLPARGLFEKIVQSAWKTGEPGIVFIDRINRDNPTPLLGRIESTNPCGEQPLLAYESCTLGSINLSRMVTGDRLNLKRLKKTVHHAVHFLDNVIEVNRYPFDRIEKASKGTRKIGLGVMGFADMLIQLGIPYDSDQAVSQAEAVMAFVQQESKMASAALGAKRGNFNAYKGSIFDTPATPHMRNASTTTIAPTGSISIIAGTSSGIEPIFAVAHIRQVMDGTALPEMHPLFVKAARAGGFYDRSLAGEISRLGSIQTLDPVPEPVKRIFRTAHDIAPQWHVRIQAAFQKHTDNAVSKTVNFPAEATIDDVRNTYLLAYRQGCKGVTIYRYGSRSRQVLNIGGDIDDGSRIAPRPRPQRTEGATERVKTGCGNLYVTVNSDQQGMCEVFCANGENRRVRLLPDRGCRPADFPGPALGR